MRALAFLGAAAALSLTACATVPLGGMLTSAADYSAVYAACVSAAGEIGFGVTSADQKSGFISGTQGVISGQGSVVTLSASVRRVGGRVEVDVSIIRPPGSIGGDDIFDRYVAAVKRKVPDVTMVPKPV